jgi:hypothetical protein
MQVGSDRDEDGSVKKGGNGAAEGNGLRVKVQGSKAREGCGPLNFDLRPSDRGSLPFVVHAEPFGGKIEPFAMNWNGSTTSGYRSGIFFRTESLKLLKSFVH